jgi:hypothetical protein
MESAPWFILALLAIYLAFSRLRSVHLNFSDREDRDADELGDRHLRRLPPDREGAVPSKRKLAAEEKKAHQHRR